LLNGAWHGKGKSEANFILKHFRNSRRLFSCGVGEKPLEDGFSLCEFRERAAANRAERRRKGLFKAAVTIEIAALCGALLLFLHPIANPERPNTREGKSYCDPDDT
jgi:hypothetical protein